MSELGGIPAAPLHEAVIASQEGLTAAELRVHCLHLVREKSLVPGFSPNRRKFPAHFKGLVCPMRVKSGSMISMPYSIEMNDIPVFLDQGHAPETFGRMICDQFDVLYEDGAKTGRVMSICLHPFLIGHPHRSKYFDQALAHITSR
jgi:hypothetical protein